MPRIFAKKEIGLCWGPDPPLRICQVGGRSSALESASATPCPLIAGNAKTAKAPRKQLVKNRLHLDVRVGTGLVVLHHEALVLVTIALGRHLRQIAVWLLSDVGAAWLGAVAGLSVGILPASIGIVILRWHRRRASSSDRRPHD
jgi:hypothetical protein